MTAFSSAELIEALRRRTRKSLRPERPPGEFPPGWRDWFALLRERIGAITGASSDAIVAILLQREPLPAPRRSGELNRWQAFATLWRQQWQPPEPEDRRQRIMALAITLVVQLLFSLFVLWLAYARYGGEPMPRGEDVVQVEFIGQGTPLEQGGGAPSTPVAKPALAAPARAARRAAHAPETPATPSSAVPATAQAARPAIEPTPASRNVPPAQPLQVTQTPQPDSSFVLPAPVPRAISIPRQQVLVPELRESPRAIEVVEVPAPMPAPVQQIRPRLPGARVVVPELQAQAETLPSPLPPLPDASARQPQLPQAQVRVPGLQATVASLPSPASSPAGTSSAQAEDAGRAPAATSGKAPTPGNTPGATAAQAGGPPSTGSGAQANPAGAGAGPKPAARPGAWPTAQAGDDWGLSDRNRPGGQSGKPGLFDENGRPRLPPGNRAEAGGGLPPGMVEENIADLDHAGTWLKRPPINYTPTRFDKFWVPSETLLENWVRRNIREIAIPIPGSSKKLRCVVSLLQLGGGCGIEDPNMQDQEAVARPPPDIPFKPELQEDQDALRQPTDSP
ncbi:hypothetical protein MQC88_01935 [Luteimonas sp. 50]|uniref:Transmembrane repetitive protein n=1 Tax=Cognatiluteimonas sedimenti TaxID=2927791 RepID=A0ABT0A165_9GAMM|nr:hypothetical protein [Lysobacter sedimenti]MCJ0824729.1 hypothetical protein [Lysobacter sedimenti]